jgi:hypothetical protein
VTNPKMAGRLLSGSTTGDLGALPIEWVHALTWRGARPSASECGHRNTFVLRDISIVIEKRVSVPC